MKHLLAGMALLAATPLCLAQTTFAPPMETAPAPPVESFGSPPASDGPAWWADADYLIWWIRHGPLPTPLVTTGDPTAPCPGALGQPGTRALFGGSGLDYGTFSGGRVSLGGWLDGEQTLGIEASGLLLEQRSVRFAIASDHAGNPPIYLPRRQSGSRQP